MQWIVLGIICPSLSKSIESSKQFQKSARLGSNREELIISIQASYINIVMSIYITSSNQISSFKIRPKVNVRDVSILEK